MQNLHSTFPGDRPGLGLLILRTAAGIATGICGGIILSRLETSTNGQFSFFSQLILSLLLITGSVFFLLGLMMPFVSITVAVCELGWAFIRLIQATPSESRFGWTESLLLASVATALIFLGPGAYSIDARLFGRKRIFIPSSPKIEEKQKP